MRKIIFCLTAALLPAVASCGNKDNLHPVFGKVTWEGAPAAGACVFFYRKGADPMNEHMVMGIVKDDGTFDLVCGSLGKGAPPGEYDVLIEWKRPSGQSKGRPLRGPDTLKGRYADPKAPRLHASVKAGRNDVPPFDLTR